MEIIKKIIKKIEENKLQSKDLVKLIQFLKKYSRKPNKEKIGIDDIQKAEIVNLFIEKKEQAQKNWIHISGEDWQSKDLNFSKIKFLIDDLEMNRIINHKILALGGNFAFELVEHQLYLDFLYEELLSIINKFEDKLKQDESPKAIKNIKLTEEEEKKIKISTKRVEKRKAFHIQREILRFKSFVERDGWLAFWKKSSVKNGLKSNPEEIARSQLMAYLKALEIEYGGFSYRELLEGAGKADVLRVNIDGDRVLFELKIYRDNTKFEEGKTELLSYMEKEELDESFYLIFDPRQKVKNLEGTISVKNKIIHIFQIRLYQQPPTKKK